mmetsp:Transcript_15917/g.23846  ORF Transcript_15917/g.23846 Transcript_15917/m.23846 type:complete len:333 (-) Transcript_15917:147-1145(-)|eukprot:CAMPEP_0194074308 /NCGR_PEP_ID=MMETSP0149-20130528/1455_1 /TAXON_ID=122233 /ORGANISM="Chaetoceros debilis, Strain MM31A-1" /LENGTH=332 /DNA_ID=CAMNT_0038754461 /DNA_START=173 /DNA_END=1171 /DNA_ORIENTATION=-
MKATININSLGLLLFLQCVIVHVTAEECNVCKGTYDIPAEFEWKEIVGGKICREVGWEAMFIDADDEKCLTDYNLVGYTHCGCEPPNQASTCSLCMDGSAPLVSTSPFDNEGFYTCEQINDYLLNFPQSPDTCHSYHQQGIDKCGCPDMMSSESPSMMPSASNKPSAAPFIASDDDVNPNRVAPAIGIGVGSAFVILVGGLFALKKNQRGRGLKRGLDASDMSKVEFIPTMQTRSDKMGLESIEVFPENYPYDDEEDRVPDSVPSDTLPTMQSLKKNNVIVRSMVGYDDSSSEEDEEDERRSEGSLPFDEDEKHKHPMNVRRSPSVSNTINF